MGSTCLPDQPISEQEESRDTKSLNGTVQRNPPPGEADGMVGDDEFMYELDEDTSRAEMRSRPSAESLDDDRQLLEKAPAMKVPVCSASGLRGITADDP